MVSVVAINTVTQSNSVRKGLRSIIWRNQPKNSSPVLETRAEGEAMGECYFLGSSWKCVQLASFIDPRTKYLPRYGTAYSGLDLLTSIINQENSP